MNKFTAGFFGGEPIPAALARIALGGIFVYASLHKIADPEQFARIIYGYKLFPDRLINLMAIVVPFLELTCGALLILNRFRKGAVTIINLMLISFITAITINLVRGVDFDCGCFSGGSLPIESDPEMLLIRDVILLIVGLAFFFFSIRDSS